MPRKKLNLTGVSFDLLTVIIEAQPVNGVRYWWCQCECGNDPVLKSQNYLQWKHTRPKSCGCLNQPKMIIEPGKRIDDSRLTAIKRFENRGYFKMWLCQCDCGSKPFVAYQHSLVSGQTKSCGCLHKEIVSNLTLPEHTKKQMAEGIERTKYKRKVRSDNRLGIKGVNQMEDGRYRAYITVERKYKHLGAFGTVEEATAARKRAEEKYFKPILDKYNQSGGK